LCLVRILIALGFIATLSACVKKGGAALVMRKEHIEAVKIRQTATTEEGVNAGDDKQTPAPVGASPADGAPAVDQSGVVNEKASVENPRATDREQWIVSVKMIDDNRWIDVPVERPQWEKLQEGDRVQVVYREGKYTGTVWSAEIR
jgi:hypothetical protein